VAGPLSRTLGWNAQSFRVVYTIPGPWWRATPNYHNAPFQRVRFHRSHRAGETKVHPVAGPYLVVRTARLRKTRSEIRMPSAGARLFIRFLLLSLRPKASLDRFWS